MLGEGMVSLGTAVVTVLRRNEKASAKIVSLQRDPVVHLEGGGLEVELALLVAEVDLQLLLRRADAAELIDEVHVPGRTTELAVGRRPQSDLLLQAYGGRDGSSSTARSSPSVISPWPCRRARLQQRGRPQQAADVVGAERWGGACGHVGPLARQRARDPSRAPARGLPALRGGLRSRGARPRGG